MGKKHTKKAKKGEKHILLRVPQIVAEAVAERANQENRSVNKQIIHELSKIYPTYEGGPKHEKD